MFAYVAVTCWKISYNFSPAIRLNTSLHSALGAKASNASLQTKLTKRQLNLLDLNSLLLLQLEFLQS